MSYDPKNPSEAEILNHIEKAHGIKRKGKFRTAEDAHAWLHEFQVPLNMTVPHTWKDHD